MITAKIIGTGSYLPDFIMKNTDFEKMVETSDEWIVTRTGIKERHIGTGMENWEMGSYAAQKAIKSAGINPETIDLIIGTTVTPDYFYPSLANIVQMKTGALNAFCFDVSAACTGFIAGLQTSWQYIQTGMAKRVLIVSAEAMSKTVDFTDRATCVLFGDGAGAVVLEASGEPGIINTCMMSEPDTEGLLACRALSPKNPFLETNSSDALFKDLNGGFLKMAGREVYKFAVKAMPAAVRKVLEGTGLSLDDIKYIIPHQANIRIINYVAEHLGIEGSKMYINIDKYANTSSATMPIALDEMLCKGLLSKHDKVIFTGFGAGLSYGAALVEI